MCLLALFLLLSLSPVAAQSLPLDARFSGIVDGRKYRLENVSLGTGGVCEGEPHGATQQVYYERTADKLGDDCLWTAEVGDQGVSFRNSVTGHYLTFTSGKDYTTHIRLKLSDNKSAASVWTVGATDGSFTFSYTEGSSVSYFMEVSPSQMVVTNSSDGGDAHTHFALYDESGQKLSPPVATPLSTYGSGITLMGQRLPYDQSGSSFFCSVGASDTRKVDLVLMDGLKTDYSLRLMDKSTAKVVTLMSDLRPEGNYVVQLMKGPDVKAEVGMTVTTMPVVEVWTSDPTGADYAPGSFSVFDGVEQPLQALRAMFRQRGATARNYPKWSLNVKLLDDEGAGLDTTVLGLRKTDKWILDAMAIDVIRMRNRVCFDLWNSYSQLPYKSDYDRRNGTKGRFVELILNGRYNGIYCLTDKINRKLLNLKKPNEGKDGSVTVRGVLYKSNSWDHTGLSVTELDNTQPMTTTDWNSWELETPDDHPSVAAWQPLKDLYSFCSGAEEDFVKNFAKNFYIDNVADFHILILALNLLDNGNKNMFLSTPNITKGHQFVITPWDLDTSIGGYYDGRYSGGNYDPTTISDARINKNNPFRRLWDDNLLDYRRVVADRWMKLRDGALSRQALGRLLDDYATLFVGSGAWAREVARWSKGTPIVSDLKAEVNHLKQWYAKRVEQMDDFLKPLSSGIEEIKATSREGKSVYGVDGRKWADSPRKLPQLPHGIYIVNGRKVAH